MNEHRYNELELGYDVKLTKEEIADGWHFCPDWDFMLIHRNWPEIKGCTCKVRGEIG